MQLSEKMEDVLWCRSKISGMAFAFVLNLVSIQVQSIYNAESIYNKRKTFILQNMYTHLTFTKRAELSAKTKHLFSFVIKNGHLNLLC
jgi:hypothetical protein